MRTSIKNEADLIPNKAKNEWGIIAYVPTPGKFPRDDEAHFDGWYSIKDWADDVYEDFRKRYPNALVHLVTRVRSDWRDFEVNRADFAGD